MAISHMATLEEKMKVLDQFAPVTLAHMPTPLEPMERLTRLLGGPNLFIKRDDCTGLASGGNKTRKLEFLMGEALAQGADTVVTQGAVQSNHVRQTAAAAARLGLRCEALLEQRVARHDSDYAASGNVLLDRLFGAQLHYRPSGLDMNRECEAYAERLRADGRRVYAIPGGGSNPVGALGYVKCALEMLQQFESAGLEIDCIVHATGSSGTQAGLLAGLALAGAEVPVLGISVRQPQHKQEDAVFDLADRTIRHVDAARRLPRSAVAVDADHVGDGYGIPTQGMMKAVRTLCEQEGILLDPVYTGKGMAGLLSRVEAGDFRPGQNVVFLHTGGSVSLFGYRSTFDAPVQSGEEVYPPATAPFA